MQKFGKGPVFLRKHFWGSREKSLGKRRHTDCGKDGADVKQGTGEAPNCLRGAGTQTARSVGL